jgi:uncharacterized small protein (DUF1192 family)
MTERRLAPTLRNLALALLNATLILAALVLWLAWRTADAVHDVTEDVDLALVGLDPVRADLALLRDEVAGLRADIAALSTSDPGGARPLTEPIEQRIAALDRRIADAVARVDRLTSDPAVLIDRAIGSVAENLTRYVARLRDCVPADAG